MAPEPTDRQRIDKWLWHARVVRTRTTAAALVTGGNVRLNGVRIDAGSRTVRIGDVVTVALDRSVRLLTVQGFSERRGGAPEAKALFADISETSPAPAAPGKPAPSPGAEAGRPSKRERRAIVRLRRPIDEA